MQFQKPCGRWNVDCSSTAIRINLVINLQDVLGVATARAFPLAKSVTAAVRVSCSDIPPRYGSVALFRVAPFTRMDFPHHFYLFPSIDEFVAPFLPSSSLSCQWFEDFFYRVKWHLKIYQRWVTMGKILRIKLKSECRTIIVNCNDDRSYTKSG